MGQDRLIAGKYRLAEKIGEGAIGVVWQAHDESLGRDVAIKEIRFPPGIAAEQARSLEKRTLREARAAARLSGNPNIVFVYEVVYEDGRPWIVMELMHGRTLDQLVKEEGPQPPWRVAAIGASVLAGLRAAHAAGIVHRDVKPSNVMFDGERTVLSDFGIAAFDGGTVLTQTGAILGTPSFMAPEQARGQFATPASDLWSLGATMYAAVEGRLPFDAESAAAALVAVLTTDPPPPKNAGPLAGVIAGLLVKDPDRRTHAAILADQLAIIANGGEPPSGPPRPIEPGDTREAHRTTTPRTRRLIALVGAGAVVGALVAVLIWQPWRTPGTQAGPRGATSSTPDSHAPTPVTTPAPATRRFPSTHLKTPPTFAIAFSPNGTRLASAGGDSTVRLWDVRRHIQLSQLPGHKDSINDIRFSRDGKMLATASDDKTVRIWDAATGKQLAVLTGTDTQETVDFSPDGRTLASGSGDHTIRIWDIASRKTIQVLHGHGNLVSRVRFSPDGRTLASASWDHTVRLWNVGTWDQRAVLNGHTGAVYGLDFSPDRRTLASSDDDGEVLLWNLATQAGVGVLTHGDQIIRSVDFSPDGKTLASGDWNDHEVVLWNVATNATIAVLKGHKSEVVGVEFSPDGSTLASSADDKTVRLWDMTR